MECETDSKATVEVLSATGRANAFWSESAVSSAGVLINGQLVGRVSNQQPLSVAVDAGILRVAARSGFLRSRTLVLSLPAGEIARLDCGFRTGAHVLLGMLVMSVFLVVATASTASGFLLPSVVPLTGMVVLAALLVDLVRSAFTPGARLYLRPRAVIDAGDIPSEQTCAPHYLVRIEPRAGRFQFGLKGLLVLVACCAPIFWLAREMWDRRPENALPRAVRMLRSDDPGERSIGAKDLQLLVLANSLRPKEVDAIIPDLLTALRDQRPAVREPVMYSLFEIVSDCGQRSLPVPRVQVVAAGLAGALRDTEFEVRRLSALALANLYFTYPRSGAAATPLPPDLDRFLDQLCEAIEDPSEEVRTWVFQVLRETAPRVGRAAPSGLVAALGSKDAVIRREAVDALVRFPVGIDSQLPKLFEVLERDEDPTVRQSCFGAMIGLRPSTGAIPALLKALRSHQRQARFRAADLLSRIGPAASDAVPAVLPLLKERFEPSTEFERKHPAWADPAVAATWALRSIAPGTPMAGMARTALEELQTSGHPWRRGELESALLRFHPLAGQGLESLDQ